MNNRNDNTPRPEMQDDIIELGVASIETKGPGGSVEPTGINVLPGITEE
ncbi:benenodin family lasso peptide [Luteimonas suaedae]|nr:benenodin family lasso peptide [Luteimonas suaedae]